VGAFDKPGNIAETIKQRVFGVYVEMDKRHGLGVKDYSMVVK
jgi:hypothetical protein